jgi:hypothetical protein
LIASRASFIEPIHRIGDSPRQWAYTRVPEKNCFARHGKFVQPQLFVRMEFRDRHHFIKSFSVLKYPE